MEASTDRRTDGRVLAGARWLAAGLTAGATAGLLVGGIGGRLAMFVLRLTSAPGLHGLQTDDGFTIGIVSTESFFLLTATAILGATVGAGYLLVRLWLPERSRPWIAGVLGALVGGARILRPGGVDFTLVDPLPLAVAMFIVIPAGVGVGTSLLAERFLRDGSWFARSRLAYASLVLAIPVGMLPVALGTRAPAALLAEVVVLGVALIAHRRRQLARVWSSAPVVWLGRAVLAAAVIASSVELARDVTTIL